MILEIAEKTVELVIARKKSRQQEVKKRFEEEQQARGRKKKPWTWLTREARKVILEVVAEIEKQGRIKIGERKKKELIKKLVSEQTNEIEERKEATIKLEVGRIDEGFQQLLSLDLVRGDRSGSGKRKRDARAGRWASWIVDQGIMGKRVWKRGLRRLGYDEPIIVEDEQPRVVLNIKLVTEEFTQDLEV